jgi:hypothetical protein
MPTINEPGRKVTKKHVTTRWEEAVQEVKNDGGVIYVFDNRNAEGLDAIDLLECEDDIAAWQEKLERDYAWKPETLEPADPKDHINPSHYKSYVKEMQWIEAMQYVIGERKGPDHFVAAVELQVRKYLDRNGRKDAELQELTKGLWYYKFMLAYVKNGKKPIRVKDIHGILGE